MFQLKQLSHAGIQGALEKAERYRLINEPGDAESICLDILEVEPDNQQALISLLLARTDQFRDGAMEVSRAREVLPRLHGEYERAYYAGIISERWAKALWARGTATSGPVAYQWLRDAMDRYEQAEPLRPPGNDSALFRWNACARMLMRHAELKPPPEDRAEAMLE